MGQQGDTGLAGYEVNTALLSLHLHHMWTQLDCCSCLTQHNCSHRAIRDPKVQWGPQDQKVKRYTSFISCMTQILSLALFLEHWSVLMFRSEQVWIYQQSEYSRAIRCPQRIELSSFFVLLFVIFSLGWAGRWWQSWRSSWFPRWHSKSLLVHCLSRRCTHSILITTLISVLFLQGPPGDRGERGEPGDPGYKVCVSLTKTTAEFWCRYLELGVNIYWLSGSGRCGWRTRASWSSRATRECLKVAHNFKQLKS